MRTQIMMGERAVSLSLPKQDYTPQESLTGLVSVSDNQYKDIAIHLLLLKQDEKKAKAPVELAKFLVPLEPTSDGMSFNLKLGQNVICTDGASGFYLELSSLTESKNSKLFVKTLPHPTFQQVVEILERFFRFKMKKSYGVIPAAKALKNVANLNDLLSYSSVFTYEFSCPAGKDFGHCTNFELSLSWKENDLVLAIESTWAKIEMQGLVMSTKKINKALTKTWPLDKIFQGKKFFDFEWCQKSWSELLQELKEKLV
jgi:hypothetical protein